MVMDKKRIQIRVEKADSLFKKTIGLIGQSEIQPLLIYTRYGIHTFGMKVPLDIIIMDEKNQVTATCKSLPPNRIFFWNPRHNRVLELPDGNIRERAIQIGDTIEIELSK